MTQAVLERQNRPLEDFYPVIYLDAIRVKVRADHHVTTPSARTAVGVDMEGSSTWLGYLRPDRGGGFPEGRLVRTEPANR